MSWDRDEAAALYESLDNLIDVLRAGIQSNQGYGTQGTPDAGKQTGDGGPQKLDIDLEPIRSFNRALVDSVPSIRLFGKSLDVTVEKIAETLTSFTTLQGAIHGLGSTSGQIGRTGAFNAIPGAFVPQLTNPNFNPTGQFVPFTPQINRPGVGGGNQPPWWTQPPSWWNAGPGGGSPSQPTGPQRRRAARNRRRMRNLSQQRSRVRKVNRIIEGSIVGGLYGGPRGALFGAGLGTLRGAGTTVNPAFLAAATATVAMPFIARSAAEGAEKILDTNRQFSAFAPGLTSALVQYDVNNLYRNITVAQGTAQSAIHLTESMDALQNAMMPARIFSGNLMNTLGSGMATGAAKFFNAGAGFFNAGNEVLGNKASGLFLEGAAEQLTGAGIGAGVGLILGAIGGFFVGGPAGAVAGGLGGARVGAMAGGLVVGAQQLFNGIGPGQGNIIPNGGAAVTILSQKFAPRTRNFN